jgi:XTP/dITP diphosphohydrolase
MTIWFATGNSHKKKEISAILGEAGVLGGHELLIPADAGLKFDPEETGATFGENALLKAGELFSLLNKNGLFKNGDAVIADDSGICVDALNGRPGIFSARYTGAGIGSSEQGAVSSGITKKLSDGERNALLLEEMGDTPHRTARFVCAMVLLFSRDRFFLSQETVEGEVVKGPEFIKGAGGFGYDPLFFIPELGRTAAELSEEEKNAISHRGKAGKQLATFLRNYP